MLLTPLFCFVVETACGARPPGDMAGAAGEGGAAGCAGSLELFATQESWLNLFWTAQLVREAADFPQRPTTRDRGRR